MILGAFCVFVFRVLVWCFSVFCVLVSLCVIFSPSFFSLLGRLCFPAPCLGFLSVFSFVFLFRFFPLFLWCFSPPNFPAVRRCVSALSVGLFARKKSNAPLRVCLSVRHSFRPLCFLFCLCSDSDFFFSLYSVTITRGKGKRWTSCLFCSDYFPSSFSPSFLFALKFLRFFRTLSHLSKKTPSRCFPNPKPKKAPNRWEGLGLIYPPYRLDAPTGREPRPP